MAETVLIIDDSPEIRALLETILPYAGYQTLSAGKGWEGLGLAFSAKPDVILVDLELPDIGGLKVLEQLNRENVVLPTIMMTGYGSEGVAARALRLGALGYLIKPFTTEEVLTTVEKALGVGRLRRDRDNLSALVDRYARQMHTLAAVSKAMVDGLDTDSLLQRIVEAALFVTRAERCWLSLLDQHSSQFRIVAQRGKASCKVTEFPATAGAESVWPVLGQGAIARLQAEAGVGILVQTGDEVKTLLQVPLRTPESVVGLLSVDRQAKHIPFGEHEEQALSILANYAVVALEKSLGAQPAAIASA